MYEIDTHHTTFRYPVPIPTRKVPLRKGGQTDRQTDKHRNTSCRPGLDGQIMGHFYWDPDLDLDLDLPLKKSEKRYLTKVSFLMVRKGSSWQVLRKGIFCDMVSSTCC